MTDQSNWTQVPNALMELMPYLPDAECRVMLVIARKTHGYHKACDIISYSQLTDATRMSRQGVINGIEGLIKRGILKRTPSGFNNGFCYEILADQVVNEVDHLKQSTKLTSQRSRPLVVNEVDHLSTQVVNEVDPQKKDLKEKKERSRTPRKSAGALPSKQEEKTPHQAIMDSYSQALGYPIKDGAKEGNAAKWLAKNNYTPEQVAACYKHLKADPWWAEKHLSLQSVAGKIGAWAQAQKPKHTPTPIPQATKPNLPDKPVPLADLAAAVREQRSRNNATS